MTPSQIGEAASVATSKGVAVGASGARLGAVAKEEAGAGTNEPKRETKDRILDAALATVAADGLMGATARRIAKQGDFNQALIFYHFGSIEELLLASLERANRRRITRFEERLNEVDSLAELVRIASELHGGPDDPDSPALAAIVTGWSNAEEFGRRVLATMQPWDELVEGAIRRSLDGTPFAALIPAKDLSWAISALYLGIEMLSRLDPGDERSQRMFASLGGLAMLAEPILKPKK